jgi:hypothetical protein
MRLSGVAAHLGRHRAADRLRRLLELAQRKQQRVRQAVAHGRAQQLHRRGPKACAQRRRLVAGQDRHVATEVDVETVVVLLDQGDLDGGVAHGVSVVGGARALALQV